MPIQKNLETYRIHLVYIYIYIYIYIYAYLLLQIYINKTHYNKQSYTTPEDDQPSGRKRLG